MMVRDIKKHTKNLQIFNSSNNKLKLNKIFRKEMIFSKSGNKRLNKRSNQSRRRKSINNICRSKYKNNRTLIDLASEKAKCQIKNQDLK